MNGNPTSLRPQSVTHASFTLRKLKMEWMKLKLPSNSNCHSNIFCTPKTQNGMNETQAPFELKVSLKHLLLPENSKGMKLKLPSNSKCHSNIFYSPKTQNGIDESQPPFELKVSFIHLLQFEKLKIK